MTKKIIPAEAEMQLLNVQCALDALAFLFDAASDVAPMNIECGHFLGFSTIIKALAKSLNTDVYGEILFDGSGGTEADQVGERIANGSGQKYDGSGGEA